MKLKTVLLALTLLFFTGFSSAAQINSLQTFNQGNGTQVFQMNQTVEFRLNATGADNATLDVYDSTDELIVDSAAFELVSSDNYQIFSYSYSTGNESFSGGNWNARAEAVSYDGSPNATDSESFHVATGKPNFISLTADPFQIGTGENLSVTAALTDTGTDLEEVNITFPGIGNFSMEQEAQEDYIYEYSSEIETHEDMQDEYTVTALDSGGRTAVESGDFRLREEQEGTDVTVEVAPSCSSTLDYFLVPGDGEIVQNKTGVFVEIIGNSGNVQSNISINYLEVTKQGQDPYSRGDQKGNIVQSYSGEDFENVAVGSSVTYFKLFNAQYPKGNYTGFSEVTTECQAEGPENEQRNVQQLENEFNCDNITVRSFNCSRVEVISENLVDSEIEQANFTNTTGETVEPQEPGTEGYETEISLNDTAYQAFVFNSEDTDSYDYSCLSDNDSIYSEDSQCAYESNLLGFKDIEVKSIGADGSNATYSLKDSNEEKLNTSLSCEDEDKNDSEATCDTDFRFFEQFSFFGNFEIVDAIGDESGGVNNTGNQSTNQSIPGNDTNPGRTNVTVPEPEPEPEPVPEPEPTPEPDPVVRIDIESMNESYSTRQGSFVATDFEVTNLGNVPLNDLQLNSLVQRIRGDWDVRNAQVENLSVNETIERQVFIRPSEDTEPGSYVVPVAGQDDQNNTLDLDYFTLNVKEADFVPRITIAESPQTLNLEAGTSQQIPVLLQNNGRVDLENISARVQNIDECGSVNSGEIDELTVNNSQSLELDFSASGSTGECETTLVVSSGGGAYAFSEIDVEITPEAGLIPEEQRVPVIALVWTSVLMLYAFFTREYDLESWTVKGPFIALVMGETLIILYLMANYYGFAASGFLPF
ncbi:MAG: hypothetical protein ACI9LV_000555 [Candidatus Nanohaloarchaea archaeon]